MSSSPKNTVAFSFPFAIVFSGFIDFSPTASEAFELRSRGVALEFEKILLVLLVIAIGGGLVISKFLFVLIVVAIVVFVFSRMGSRSST